MRDEMKSFNFWGGPLDGQSKTVSENIDSVRVPLGPIQMHGVAILSDGGYAPSFTSPAAYEYRMASHGEYEAFVPANNDALRERFHQCGADAHARGHPLARFLAAELFRRGAPVAEAGPDLGLCDVPGCTSPTAGWHKLGVGVCEQHFMLNTDELESLLND